MNGTLEARRFWNPLLRGKLITFSDLRAVTENIRYFSNHLKDGTHVKVLEDNHAEVQIPTAIKSKSRKLMKELSILHELLLDLGMTIESQYVPSAVNRFADRLLLLHTLYYWRINQGAIQYFISTLPP